MFIRVLSFSLLFLIASPAYSLTGANNTLFEFYLTSYINNEPSKNELIQEIMNSRGIEEVNYKISQLIYKISENRSLTADQKDSLINSILGALYPKDLDAKLMKNKANRAIILTVNTLLNIFGFNFVTYKLLYYLVRKNPDFAEIKVLILSSHIIKKTFIPAFDKNTKGMELRMFKWKTLLSKDLTDHGPRLCSRVLFL